MQFKVIELTKENQEYYLEQVAELEKIVLRTMETEGKIGQLFITGIEDIAEYVNSENDTVMIAVDDKKSVKSAVYITQGQKAFTYNDITKYFKYGSSYDEFVKSQYSSEIAYKKDMIEAYEMKIKAYEYAKSIIEQKYSEYPSIMLFLEHEILENNFHEKSILREELNFYMAEYIENNFKEDGIKLYEKFFWTKASDIAKEFGKELDSSHIRNELINEYETILDNEPLIIYEGIEFGQKQYFSSNTRNAVEIDTYITDPNKRHAGIARILVYEGIKKHMQKHFSNPNNSEIFLCSTLHRDNLSSKYVSEFFGLEDHLFVNRRQNRDREVHICRVLREDYEDYLEHLQDKLIVLYGYNPKNKQVDLDTQMEIIDEQMQYEKREIERLTRICKDMDKYTGKIDMHSIESKLQKVKKLKEKYIQIESAKKAQSKENKIEEKDIEEI